MIRTPYSFVSLSAQCLACLLRGGKCTWMCSPLEIKEKEHGQLRLHGCQPTCGHFPTTLLPSQITGKQEGHINSPAGLLPEKRPYRQALIYRDKRLSYYRHVPIWITSDLPTNRFQAYRLRRLY